MRTRGQIRKDQILNVAAQMLVDRGDVLVTELSQTAKASIGSIYHHFQEKQKIVLLAGQRALDLYFESLRAAFVQLAAKSAKRKKGAYGKRQFARRLVRHHFEYMTAHPAMDRILAHHLSARRLTDELTPLLPKSLSVESGVAGALFGLLLFTGESDNGPARGGIFERPDRDVVEQAAQRIVDGFSVAKVRR